MARRPSRLLTLTPPTLDRFGFAEIDRALSVTGPETRRDWLLARFSEGLQMRCLRAPGLGMVAFTPGRWAWVPIIGADRAVVVHDLRVGEGSTDPATVQQLWSAVEDWARFYGFAAVLALTGPALGLIPPDLVTGRQYHCLDAQADGTRLIGKILHGPLSMPGLPQDWLMRAALLGPGLVVQTTGRSQLLESRAMSLVRRARQAGMQARHDLLEDARAAQSRAVGPVPLFSVVLEGRRIPTDGLSEMQIWHAIGRRAHSAEPA